jgi:hypothetical protein
MLFDVKKCTTVAGYKEIYVSLQIAPVVPKAPQLIELYNIIEKYK